MAIRRDYTDKYGIKHVQRKHTVPCGTGTVYGTQRVSGPFEHM